jgi:hypothetical protein
MSVCVFGVVFVCVSGVLFVCVLSNCVVFCATFVIGHCAVKLAH